MSRHRQSITLVGRASNLAFHDGLASFTLTVKGRGELPELVVRCEGLSSNVHEQFELMDEGCLVGVIGNLAKRNEGAHALVLLVRLEYLGKPLAAA
jgi:hypothetical protein